MAVNLASYSSSIIIDNNLSYSISSGILCFRSSYNHMAQVKICQGSNLNPPPVYAFGDQKPFREKVSGLPKASDNGNKNL